MTPLECSNVKKMYGSVEALRDLSFSFSGRVLGLVGPNGAGKTTLLQSILGLVTPDSGQIRVFGQNPQEDALSLRARMGYMPEGDAVPKNLSALDWVTFAGALSGLPRNEAKGRAHGLLELVGLGESRLRKLGSFSTGMKQRARLAQALSGDPELLILDEPTSGMDPAGRDALLALIASLPNLTRAKVILSSHILEDLETTCTDILWLREGALVFSGELDELLTKSPDPEWEVRVASRIDEAQAALEKAGYQVQEWSGSLRVQARSKDASFEGACALLATLHGAGAQVRRLVPLERTLDEVYASSLRDDE